MSIVDRIRRGFPATCVTQRLERPGCRVYLSDTPKPRLLIDLDLPGSPLDEDSVRCDYLGFVDNVNRLFCVAPVEFKRTWRENTVRQLQAGANEAEKHVPRDCEFSFRPIGVFERFSPKAARTSMRRRVTFRGRSEPIRVIRCGDQLAKALGTRAFRTQNSVRDGNC